MAHVPLLVRNAQAFWAMFPTLGARLVRRQPDLGSLTLKFGINFPLRPESKIPRRSRDSSE
jgi:hypothetical protein